MLAFDSRSICYSFCASPPPSTSLSCYSVRCASPSLSTSPPESQNCGFLFVAGDDLPSAFLLEVSRSLTAPQSSYGDCDDVSPHVIPSSSSWRYFTAVCSLWDLGFSLNYAASVALVDSVSVVVTVHASSVSLSILLRLSDQNSKTVQGFTSLNMGVVSLSFVPSHGTFIASLPSITAVCSWWYEIVACLKVWFSTPRSSHPLVTSSGCNFYELFSFWNLHLPQYVAVMSLIQSRTEAMMISIMLMLPLPQYEDVRSSIKLMFSLPQYEAVMSSIKFRTLLPQYEDVIHKLMPSSIRDIVLLVGFYERSRWFLKKTVDVLTNNNLGSSTLDLFIVKWWYSQVHTSPKLRVSSDLVGLVSWCFVAYAFVAVFQDVNLPLVDAASPGSRSPSVLSVFQSLVSLSSTIGVSNYSCSSVMYASICFLQFYRVAFVAAVSLAFVALMLYLLNYFSISGE